MEISWEISPTTPKSNTFQFRFFPSPKPKSFLFLLLMLPLRHLEARRLKHFSTQFLLSWDFVCVTLFSCPRQVLIYRTFSRRSMPLFCVHPPQKLNFPNNFTDRGKTAAETELLAQDPEPDCPARALNTPSQRYHPLMHQQTMKPVSAHAQRASLESCCNSWMSLFPAPAILAKGEETWHTGFAGGVLHTAKLPGMKRLVAEAGTPPKPMLSPVCCRHGWRGGGTWGKRSRTGKRVFARG